MAQDLRGKQPLKMHDAGTTGQSRTSGRKPLSGRPRLRLLTYNIHKCIGGLDRLYRPERIQAVVRHYDPDVLLLQEVDEEVRRSNRDRQVELLGRMVGLKHRSYFPNVRVRGGGVYGNAILSRLPVQETRNIDLTMPRRKRRSVLHASFRVPLKEAGRARTIHIFNLHLGLSGRERERQLRRFLDSHPFVRLHHGTPIIVAGDFNDLWGTLGKKLLEPAGFSGQQRPIRTFPAYAPVRALDAVYVRGEIRLRNVFRSHLRLARQASDHLPLFAEIELL
jgi:endonuclease/exonuclease/phosphatase family metal-dependent hydrolase